MQKPLKHHFQAIVHVLRYLKDTMKYGLIYNKQPESSLKLNSYYDADWGACLSTRRSLIGYYIFIGSSLISWKTKKQNVVRISSAEAEYTSLSQTGCEFKWISHLLEEFGIKFQHPLPMHCDNLAAIEIAKNPVFHYRIKHVEIDIHPIRELVATSFIQTIHVYPKHQLEDVFTKTPSHAQMLPSLINLGMI